MRFVPCRSCHRHVRTQDTTCPFCAASLTTSTSGRLGIAVVGFVLVGCVDETVAGGSNEPDPMVTYDTTTTTGEPIEGSSGTTEAWSSSLDDVSESDTDAGGETYAGPGMDSGSTSGEPSEPSDSSSSTTDALGTTSEDPPVESSSSDAGGETYAGPGMDTVGSSEG